MWLEFLLLPGILEVAACLAAASVTSDAESAGALLAEAPLASLAPGGALHPAAAGAHCR